MPPPHSPAEYERCLCIQIWTACTAQVSLLATKWATIISLLNNNLGLDSTALSISSEKSRTLWLPVRVTDYAWEWCSILIFYNQTDFPLLESGVTIPGWSINTFSPPIYCLLSDWNLYPFVSLKQYSSHHLHQSSQLLCLSIASIIISFIMAAIPLFLKKQNCRITKVSGIKRTPSWFPASL